MSLVRWQEQGYAEVMSNSTAQLLEAFEALPEDDKRAFTAEFLRSAIPYDWGPIDDKETAHAADQLLGEQFVEDSAPARRAYHTARAPLRYDSQS